MIKEERVTEYTSFGREVSIERRATLKDLFKMENLDPIAVGVVDDALESGTGLFSILKKKQFFVVINSIFSLIDYFPPK